MPFQDEKGNPVDPAMLDDQIRAWKAKNPGAAMISKPNPAAGVRYPSEALGILAKQWIPLAALGGLGLALDQPEMELPLLARMGVMGAGNAAFNRLAPESVGGEPDASLLGSFAAGALPEGATILGGRLGTKFLENRIAKRGEGAMEGALGKLDPETMAVRERMMAPRGNVPVPKAPTGPELTRQTFAFQQPVNQTVQAARTKYGAPIGEAYQSLKGEAPIDATGFAKVADDLKGELISPTTGGANSLLQRFKMMDPAAQKEAFDRGVTTNANKEVVDPHILLPNGEFYVPGRPDIHMSPGSPMPKGEFKAKPAKLDQLRNLRQKVNTQLRTAQGGDVHLLGALQDQIDEELMPHLPANMQDLRKTYAGFINRWGYRQQAAFNRLKNPQEVSDWIFSDPTRAHDLFAEASPAQQGQLRQQFIQHVYGPLDSTKSEAEQFKDVKKRLTPYMQDRATAKLVMGPNAGEQMRDLAQWPKFTADFKEQWEKNPKFRDQMLRGWRDLVVSQGQDPDEAATKLVTRLTGGNAQLGQVVSQLPAPPPRLPGPYTPYS